MLDTVAQSPDIDALMNDIGRKARAASRPLAFASTESKNRALAAMADAILARKDHILAENAKDLKDVEGTDILASFVDRLTLTEKRVAETAEGIRAIAALPDPVGEVIAAWDRPNGLKIERVRTPLGVIGVIFESRPNVTADAGALCLKAGNAVILRCGSDSRRSSQAILECLVEGLKAAGLPEHAIQLVPVTDRAAVGAMLRGLEGTIDVIVPRGVKAWWRACRAKPAYRSSPISKASATSISTPPPISIWPKRSSSTPRCAAPAFAAPPKRCWLTPRRRRHI